jgi:hypothetical protein
MANKPGIASALILYEKYESIKKDSSKKIPFI